MSAKEGFTSFQNSFQAYLTGNAITSGSLKTPEVIL